jgi:hypothetical protein
MEERTHHTVHDGVFAEKDDFSRCADKPFSVLRLPLCHVSGRLVVCEFLDGTGDSSALGRDRSYIALVRVSACGEGDRSSLQKGTFKIVEEVSWVFDPNTKSDQVLRKAARRTRSRVDRRMSRSERSGT